MSGQSKIARRTFFTSIGLAAAAGAAAKLSSTGNAVARLGNSVTPESKDNGYRLSEHIKKYYRSTTI